MGKGGVKMDNPNTRGHESMSKKMMLAEYQKIADQAWAEYQKSREQALAEYERIVKQARAEYQESREQAWAEYKKIVVEQMADATKGLAENVL